MSGEHKGQCAEAQRAKGGLTGDDIGAIARTQTRRVLVGQGSDELGHFFLTQ